MPRMLVVDDEKDVRAMISIVLRVRHFEATEAVDASAALKAFGGSSFDAAIVDIVLAESNGFDLIVALRERAPGLPVVAVSGIATGDLASPAAGLANVASLQKPFRPNDLMAAIVRACAPAMPAVGPDKSKRPGRAGRSMSRLAEKSGFHQEPFSFTSA